MEFIKDFIKDFGTKKEVTKLIIKPENKNGINDLSESIFAKTVVQNNYYSDSVRSNDYDSIIKEETKIELKEKLYPIKDLISDGKIDLAIKQYNEIISSIEFEDYSKDERFLIYNGLLNCYININAEKETIMNWVIKIKALGTDIEEIHRFYYLLAIWEYNNKELDKALILIGQSIIAKPDYINAITGELLFKCAKQLISYDDAKSKFGELLQMSSLDIEDTAAVYSAFGDVAFNSKDFNLAEEMYSKSNKLSKNISKDIGIAICTYFQAFKEIKENGNINLEDIDFNMIKNAEELFDDIYLNGTSETMQTIVRKSFSFLFNILALTNKYDKIITIYTETKDYFNSGMSDTIKHVAEAEIFNGILNRETLSSFDEYEQIKYEALYYERTKNYVAEIVLLLPALEGKYRGDKILQLSLLNAFKESNQFDRYMEYYRKFSGHNDEVMRMNYIQFLINLNKKDMALVEMQKLKSVIQNPFVLYELLLIYLDFDLVDELDEFFNKVDSGEYKIIGLQMAFVFYQKMIHLLNRKRYDEYFNLYEDTDLSFLKEIQRLILKINFFTFKGELDELATAFYQLFQLTNDHNELLKAVQIKLEIGRYHESDFYLEQVNPMELESPEMYYIFKAIILKEFNKLDEAFDTLNEIIDLVQDNMESPFHQFYTAFNMNNGRTDDAVIYMTKYFENNSNPNWFKVIQHSENETGKELIDKLEEVIGGRRDLSQINLMFSKGVIGITLYSHLVGNSVEEILYNRQYPFTRVNISAGDVKKSMEDVDLIDNKLLIDATTLSILTEIDALSLLDVFDEILVPYSVVQNLQQRESCLYRTKIKQTLKYLQTSPYVKNISVDEGLKIKDEISKLLPEDTLDCIALSKYLSVPFLNTEVTVCREFSSEYIIDINALLFYLKRYKPILREQVAIIIANLRGMGIEFISFDAEDMFIVYMKNGLEGIKPFLKMGANADYKTFTPQYINFLSKILNEKSIEEFELCASVIIRFIDKYVGKTRYYMFSIMSNYPIVEDDFLKLIKSPSVKNVLLKNTTYTINAKTAKAYLYIIDSYDFQKILSITTAFVGFVIQFIALFKDDEAKRMNYINFIKENISINDSDDIDYILHYITRFLKSAEKKVEPPNKLPNI